jgi:gamma-glutamylcyclotransferase (GGCT)/AIG2-like uncharacterized protein YtfP
VSGTPLFGYGTFRHHEWRCRILGADYPWELATIVGWKRVALPSGYLTVVASPNDLVEGVLVELDDVGWRIADAWEEVPTYRRLPVVARTTAGVVAAQMYVVPGVADGRAVNDDRFAVISDYEVVQSIRAFERAMLAIRAGLP